MSKAEKKLETENPRDCGRTPRWLVDVAASYCGGPFGLDVAADFCNAVGDAFYSREQDALAVGGGVLEVVEDHLGDTYRAVYTVKIDEAVYVLHCFQKKSKQGIETPKHDMDLIRERLKAAQADAKGA